MKRLVLFLITLNASLFTIGSASLFTVQAQDNATIPGEGTTITIPVSEGPVMVPKLKKIIVPAKKKAVLRKEPNAHADIYPCEDEVFVVMHELDGWYQVAAIEYSEDESGDRIDPVMVYASKKEFKEARLQPVTEALLRQTNNEVSIRKSGKYKGLCILWNKNQQPESGLAIRIGRINNEGIACFRTNDWYVLDEENERVFIRCWYEQAEVEFQLGKICTRRNKEGKLEADFTKLTDEDLDKMIAVLEGTNVYESAYASIEKRSDFFFMYLPMYGNMGNYWDSRYSIDEEGPAYELVPVK